MEKKVIIDKMYELAKLIDYAPNNIEYLKEAMYCQSLENKKDEYADESLATLGDAVLKLILTEHLYRKHYNKAEITNVKQAIEKNETLSKLCNKYKIYQYAYNDTYFFTEAPLDKQLPHSEHDFYIEAIIGAIYQDRGMKYCKNWVIQFFQRNSYPL